MARTHATLEVVLVPLLGVVFSSRVLTTSTGHVANDAAIELATAAAT